MLDTESIESIGRLVRRPFRHRMEGDRCVELDLTSEFDPYQGLIRHLDPQEKQAVLTLVGRLEGLRVLNLRRNLLGDIGPMLGRLRELEHLNLGSNYLGKMPDEIQGLNRLRSLQMGNNDLTQEP